MNKKLLTFVAAITLTLSFSMSVFAYGWQSSGGRWWYGTNTNNSTYYSNGWQLIGGDWYYFDGAGWMAQNQWIGDYYVGSSGAMLTNTQTPDGYWVGADGRWVQNTVKKLSQAQVEAVFGRFWNEHYASTETTALHYWEITKMTDEFAYIYMRWYTGYHGEASINLYTGDCYEVGPLDTFELPVEEKYLFNAWTY